MDDGEYMVPAHNHTHYYVSKLIDRKRPSLIRAVRTPTVNCEWTTNYDAIAAAFNSQEEADLFKQFLSDVAAMLPRWPEEMALKAHLDKTRAEAKP